MKEITVDGQTTLILDSPDELSKTKSGLMPNLKGIMMDEIPEEKKEEQDKE